MIRKFAIGLASLTAVLSLQAANTGFDDASNAPYNDGWQTGDNGGTGYGAWTLNSTGNSSQAGFFMGSSSANAGGSSGNIDTAGRSWGMYANTGQLAEAFRPLTGGSLLVGQSITLSIDTGFIQSTGSQGFGLQTSGGVNRMEFFFNGGDTNYTLADSTGSHNTGIGFTGNGLSFLFTLTGTDTYSLSVNGGTPFTGTLEGVAGTGIGQMRFFDFNAGNGSDGNFYVNLLTVPEASPRIFFVLPALLGVFFLRRRRAA